MKTRILFILMVSVLCINVFAQKEPKKGVITGMVVDAENKPVTGAMIFIDDINSGTKTNKEGLYKVKVKPSAKIISVFTAFSGMENMEIKGSVINFTLQAAQNKQFESAGTPAPEKKPQSETIPEETFKSNFNKVKGDPNRYSQYTDIYQMLNGAVPGVNVTGKNITIRGQSSLYGNTTPLFVVDGVVSSSIDNIRPAEVKSIEVIKSSSAAIYGSRGSNGVIVITLIKATDAKK